MEAIARSTGAFINSVMLGVIAGSGRLPIPVEAFEAAIRADGKARRRQPARLPRRSGSGAGRPRSAASRRIDAKRSAASPRSPISKRDDRA